MPRPDFNQELRNGVLDNPLTDSRLDKARTPFDGKKNGDKSPKGRAHVKGDMHGNSLNFLHALMANGVVQFKGDPTVEELKLLGIPPGPPLQTPADSYEFFKRMYVRPLKEWKKGELEQLLNLLSSRIEVSDYNKLINMGDDFFDRGNCDAFTMMLFMKVAQKSGALTTILSNHASFLVLVIERYKEELKKGKNEQEARAIAFDRGSYPEFIAYGADQSGMNLLTLLDSGAISMDYILNFYDKSFIPNVKLIHFLEITDSNNHTELQLFCHAPVNEFDILRAALCCLDETSDPPLSAAQRQQIMDAIAYAKGTSGSKLNNQDVKNLINIINGAVKFHGEKGGLSKFLDREIINDHGLNFPADYGRLKDYPGKPLRFLFWNRLAPKENLKKAKIQTECDFNMNHGHVGPEEDFPGCTNFDSDLAKIGPGHAGDFVAKAYDVEIVTMTMTVGGLYDKGLKQNDLQQKLETLFTMAALSRPMQSTGGTLAGLIFNMSDKAARNKMTAALFRVCEAMDVWDKDADNPATILDYIEKLKKFEESVNGYFPPSTTAAKEKTRIKDQIKELEKNFISAVAVKKKKHEDIAVEGTVKEIFKNSALQAKIKTLAQTGPLRAVLLKVANAYHEVYEATTKMQQDQTKKELEDELQALEVAIHGSSLTDPEKKEAIAALAAEKNRSNPAQPAAGAAVTKKKGVTAPSAKATHRELKNNIGVLVGVLKDDVKRDQVLQDINNAKVGDFVKIDKQFIKVNNEMKTAAQSADPDKQKVFEGVINAQIQAYKAAKPSTSRVFLNDYADISKVTAVQQDMQRRNDLKQWASAELPPQMQQALQGKTHVVAFQKAKADSKSHEVTVNGVVNKLSDVTKVYDNSPSPVFKDNQDLCNQLNKSKVQMNIDGKDYFIRGVVEGGMVLFKKCEKDTDDPKTAPYVSNANVAAHGGAFGVDVMNKLGAELAPALNDVTFMDDAESAKLRAKMP